MNISFPTVLLLSSLCFGQTKNECLKLFSDSASGYDLYGYKTKNEIKIPAKFLSTYSDRLCKMAIVLDPKKGWIGIDKNERFILRPFIYDNGPDYVEEGLFRFTENEKMGFANLNGDKVIPAKFGFVTPFKNGLSEYSIGGERIYENGKTERQNEQEHISLTDVHWIWGGNITEQGYMNKQGQKFKEVSPLKNNARMAITIDHKKVLLNKKGQIIKRYEK